MTGVEIVGVSVVMYTVYVLLGVGVYRLLEYTGVRTSAPGAVFAIVALWPIWLVLAVFCDLDK